MMFIMHVIALHQNTITSVGVKGMKSVGKIITSDLFGGKMTAVYSTIGERKMLLKPFLLPPVKSSILLMAASISLQKRVFFSEKKLVLRFESATLYPST